MKCANYCNISIYLILFVTVICVERCLSKKLPKIAIIGGGIGGTSASYFLYELFGPNGAQIDLYEPNKVGGRLSVIEVNGREYEVGGSIIHPRNKYMVDFLRLLGLKKRDTKDFRLTLYDGEEIIFEESKWQLINYVKMAWRYGFGPLKLQNYIDTILHNFESIYSLQGNGETYTTVAELLSAMSPQFVKDMVETTEDGLIKSGFSEKLISELVAATLTANYGQSTKVHEFVGSVSVAGADGGLWAVHGGNKVIPELLLKYSQARLVEAKVTNITLRPESEDFIVHSKFPINNRTITEFYDIVIVATPLCKNTHTNIKFSNFPKVFDFSGKFHRTVCTIVQGKLNATYFGFEDDVGQILTVKSDLEFSAFGRIVPVDYEEGESVSDVWKIFSSKPFTEEQFQKYFTEYGSVNVVDWMAYPNYNTEHRRDQFVLHKNLFHINAVEWAASAMEMSAIGAKNAALLSYKNWNHIRDKKIKDEL